MRLSDINIVSLMESYKDARIKFSRENDPQEVKDTLTHFKELSKQNKIKGEKKDISYWMKRPFSELKQFLSNDENIKSNKEAKREIKAGAVKVASWGDWIAVHPKTEAASCEYGANTQWCTAATRSDNYFNSYTRRGVKLIYFINTKTNEKFALSISTNHIDTNAFSMLKIPYTYEIFDAEDDRIYIDELLSHIWLTAAQLEKIVLKVAPIKDTEDMRNHVKDKISEIMNYNMGDLMGSVHACDNVLNYLETYKKYISDKDYKHASQMFNVAKVHAMGKEVMKSENKDEYTDFLKSYDRLKKEYENGNLESNLFDSLQNIYARVKKHLA